MNLQRLDAVLLPHIAIEDVRKRWSTEIRQDNQTFLMYLPIDSIPAGD